LIDFLKPGETLRRLKTHSNADGFYIRVERYNGHTYDAEVGDFIGGQWEPVRKIKIGATWQLTYERIQKEEKDGN
jgi:hypothetical protein